MTRRVLLVLVGLFVACGPSSNPSGPTAASTPRRIAVLGDSLAVSPTLPESFPARLQARIDAHGLNWIVVNESDYGDTTADGLARLADVLGRDIQILVLELGANDGLDGVPVETIRRNLSAIIEAAERRNVRVLLCGMETPPARGFDYSIDFHLVFPAVAERHGIALVPFLLAGIALHPDYTGPDRVHPNTAGAERIAETVWPYLRPML
jgi:acyl-CoA thioesterase I